MKTRRTHPKFQSISEAELAQCPDWGKCKASKKIIAEEPEYYYPGGRSKK